MTMVGDPRDEALISVARNMVAGNGRRRSERVMYYRSPRTKVDGSPYAQAGWVGWGDTQDQVQLQKIRRGFIPMEQYGLIEAKRREDDPDGPFEIYGPWGQILCSPSGILEFPLDQIMAYHWYDEQRLRFSLNGNIPPTLKVKNGIVLWPQLQGHEIKVYACPECSNQRYIEAAHLARHLRLWHEYDRADIISFGKEYGIDFEARMDGTTKVVREYIFDDAPLEPLAEAGAEDIGFSVSVAQPQRRGPGRPRKEETNGFAEQAVGGSAVEG